MGSRPGTARAVREAREEIFDFFRNPISNFLSARWALKSGWLYISSTSSFLEANKSLPGSNLPPDLKNC